MPPAAIVRSRLAANLVLLASGCAAVLLASPALASGGSGSSGGSGGGGTQVDTIKVSKAYAQDGTGMLIKASSSDASAHLYAYLPDGTYYGEVQNGGGSRYGGTVMPYLAKAPATITIRSSSGGSVTVATTPFQI